MKTILKFLYLILLFLFFSNPVLTVFAQSEEHISSTVEVILEDTENCQRTIQGTTTIQWPLLPQYFDVIFVQDASGSFTNTMPQVKETLKNMVNLLDLGVTANGYPKDRAMLVTYQGSHGFGISQLSGAMTYQYYNWFGYKITSTGLTNDKAKLDAAINAISPLGATPTIDGLVRAQTDYANALDPNNVYDAQLYFEDGQQVRRRTVYFLITDGVANSGIYSNFPAGTKPIAESLLRPIDANRSYTWVYENIGKAYFELYWQPENSELSTYTYKNAANQDEFYRTFTDEFNNVFYIKDPATTSIEPYFMYIKAPNGNIVFDTYTYDPWEHYTLMMESLEVKAQELKTTGGLPYLQGEPMADAYFVSAYWEDLIRFVSGKLRGITYRPTVRPVVTNAMKRMATQDNFYVSHTEGADFAEFQENLMEAFKLSQHIRGNLYITLDPNVTFIEDSINFYAVEAGSETKIDLASVLDAEKQMLTITLDTLPKGEYRFEYQLLESSYLKEPYYPVTEIKIICDDGNCIVRPETGILQQVDGFDYPPCEVDPPLPDTGFPVDKEVPILPNTGFRIGSLTFLPSQPTAKMYASTPMKLEIPRLEKTLEIVGVPMEKDLKWDVTWLNGKAGYLYGTAYPTWSGNTVLTSHVWDAFDQPGPFAGLKQLQFNDLLLIHAFGKVYEYSVQSNEQIQRTDIDKVMRGEDFDWVTLLTCENYDQDSGTYESRRMVRAILTKVY